jgi:hypothetical protein
MQFIYKFILFFVISILYGCSSYTGGVSDEKLLVNRDAGVVMEDYLTYDFLVGGSMCRNVESVFANCGCTELSLKQGDIFDYSRPFQVKVQLNKEHWGKSSQKFVVNFVDGTALAGELSYNYLPYPYSNTETLLFFADVDAKTISLHFPGEDNVIIKDIIVPKGIAWKKTNITNAKKISIEFSIDRVIFQDTPSGSVEILTTSNRKPSFVLPYIVLYH